MKMSFAIAIFFTLANNQIHTQTFEWAKRMGGNSATNGNSITIDKTGNVYTTGDFMETTDFDPGDLTYSLNSSGGTDIFIQKLDAEGNFLWARHMGGGANDGGESVSVDAGGNVYTIGYFSGTVDFDPGTEVFELTSSGSTDIFVQKLDAEGNFSWARRMGSTNDDKGLSIVADAEGNVYTTGYFGQFSMDFGPGEGFTLGSRGIGDIFVVKINTNGDPVWWRGMGGSRDDAGLSITLDLEGNVYTTGYFRSTVDFDPGTGVFELNTFSTASFSTDIFVQKLDADGNFLWAMQAGGEESDGGNGIATDEDGNVFITGYFRQTAHFDTSSSNAFSLISNGESDIFILKLNGSGNMLWANQMGGSGFDGGQSVVTDKVGNIYTTGSFESTVDFDPGSDSSNLKSMGFSDIYIQKIESNGNFAWAGRTGANFNDGGSCIAVDEEGNVYSTGYFFGNSDFNTGTDTYNLKSSGGKDAYILKLDPLPLFTQEARTSINANLHPNPSSSLVQIQTSEVIESVSMYNALGALVLTEMRNNFYIDHLPSGIYFLHVKTQKGSGVIRLVKV
jgi:hypothetical protein